MNPKEFAKILLREKKELKDYYFNEIGNTSKIGVILRSLNFESNAKLKDAIDEIISDTIFKRISNFTDIDSKLSDKITGFSELSIDEFKSQMWKYYSEKFYEIDGTQFDFKAKLNIYKTEVSGRVGPIGRYYRPTLKFDSNKYMTSSSIYSLKSEITYLGDKVECLIAIVGKDYFSNKLDEGLVFGIYEGARKIGQGTILEILNLDLRK